MEKEIKDIIETAKKLKMQGSLDFEIAKYVHIELGKLIIYDNNYTTRNVGFDINNNQEGKISEEGIRRQKRILNSKTSVKNRRQVCKGMAEIYAAILSGIGIDANVVGVNSKEEVEGEKREDGSIINVPEKYKCVFDNDMNIIIENKESENNANPSHWYCVIQTEKGEYIQDYLTEKALARIKIGETNIEENQLAGFHSKKEHRDRALNSNININESFRNKVLSEYQKYCKENNNSDRIFNFIFAKLSDFISDFGFEEAKDFIDLVGRSLPIGEFIQKPNNINIVKENEESCEVACIYQYNGKSYLVRSGMSDLKIPIGEMTKETIEKIFCDGFKPRKLSDAKKLSDMIKKEHITISMKSIVINAIKKGITIEDIENSNKIEQIERQNQRMEGVVTKDD